MTDLDISGPMPFPGKSTTFRFSETDYLFKLLLIQKAWRGLTELRFFNSMII